MKVVVLLILCCVCVVNISYAQITLQPRFPLLSGFSFPVDAVVSPDGSKMFVVEQPGKIYWMPNNDTASQKHLLLDLSSRVNHDGDETGVLSIAFHPQYLVNGYIYVTFTEYDSSIFTVNIVRYRVAPEQPDSVFPGSEQKILRLRPTTLNHHGGTLLFGPDGYLYIGIGDGNYGDPFRSAQNKNELFGKLLRIDVDHPDSSKMYGIPNDNPFVNDTTVGAKEIYAYGFRNPWKYSFDRLTNEIWLGDVGHDRVEEINRITIGGNYGWSVLEGNYRFNDTLRDTSAMIAPVWQYPHDNNYNDCVTGGYVYRGAEIEGLFGKYVYGDFISGRIWCLSFSGDTIISNQLIVDKSENQLFISSFVEEKNGELEAVSFNDGKIYKLVGVLGVKHTSPSVANLTMTTERTIINDEVPETLLHLKVNDADNIRCGLYDVNGREVQTICNQRFDVGTFDLRISKSGLSAGAYIIKANSSTQIATQKILIQ